MPVSNDDSRAKVTEIRPKPAASCTMGATAAAQAVDRLHLIKDVRDALELLMRRQNQHLRSRTLATSLFSTRMPENVSYAVCRLRQLTRQKVGRWEAERKH